VTPDMEQEIKCVFLSSRCILDYLCFNEIVGAVAMGREMRMRCSLSL